MWVEIIHLLRTYNRILNFLCMETFHRENSNFHFFELANFVLQSFIKYLFSFFFVLHLLNLVQKTLKGLLNDHMV